MSKLWFSFLPGLLFGVGLAISGMTDPAKVTNFLDVAGTWDPSLAVVMAGALTTFAVARRFVLRRSRPLLGGTFPRPASRTIDARLVLGSALFGVGWGVAGFCPGPAVANLAAGHLEALAFVAAMVVGMRGAQLAFGADRS